MLVFVNIDCLTRTLPAATDPGPGEPLGLPGFESVLDAWPQLGLVITSEIRYRMTIEQLRALFAQRHRPQVIATTLLYGALARRTTPTREQEILDWLRHADAERADWLALDDRGDDFQAHADRLVSCASFDRPALEALRARLLQRADHRPAALPARSERRAGPAIGSRPGPAGPRAVTHADRPETRSSSQPGSPR